MLPFTLFAACTAADGIGRRRATAGDIQCAVLVLLNPGAECAQVRSEGVTMKFVRLLAMAVRKAT